tara:strand:+ start:490 stop:1125 length:636 start_codon:yes stop_codon:yes gene_type:complete
MSRHIVDLPEDWKNILINKYNNDYDILFYAQDMVYMPYPRTLSSYIIVKKDNKYIRIQSNHWTDTSLETLECGVFMDDKYNKKGIIKFMEFMFKRDVYREVNGGEQAGEYRNEEDTKTINHQMLCSIFDYEFYKLLSKKFKIYRFDDLEFPDWGNSINSKCHHVLSKRIKLKEYKEKSVWEEEGKYRYRSRTDEVWKSFESPEINHKLVTW